MIPPAALLLAALLPLIAGPPRLLRLEAQASYAPGGLTGTATLTVAGVGQLSLEPFGVAILSAHRADGTRLPLTPTLTGLGVPVTGNSRLSLDWSARGDDRLALPLPPAAVRTLDLDLPADRVPLAGAAVVTGPFPAAAQDRRRWTIRFGGRDPLTLQFTSPPAPANGPLVRADRLMRWELAPGVATWTAEFTLELIRGPLSAITVDLPPGLTLTATDPPGGLVSNGRVTVPVVGNRVMLSGFAPPPTGPWTAPRLALAGGLPGADTLVVTRSPDVTLVGCDPRSTQSVASGRTLTFTGMGSPILTLANGGAEVRTTEEQSWRVGRTESTMALKLTAVVVRGPLDRLMLTVPSGYKSALVRAVPDDPGLTTALVGDQLTVTPSQAVPTGGRFVLEAEFTAPPPLPASDPAFPSPPPLQVAMPIIGVSATDRTGTVNLTTGTGLRAWPTPTPMPFRGQPIPAIITLTADRPAATAATDIQVSPVPGGLAARATVEVVPSHAPVGGVSIWLPTGWRLRSDGLAVAPVASGEPLAGGLVAALGGQVVRLILPQPSTDPIRFGADRYLHAAPQQVPLPVVLGMDSSRQDVQLDRVTFDADRSTGGLTPVLDLRPRGAVQPSPPGGWEFTDPELFVRVGPTARELTFAITVRRAVGMSLPLVLPDAAELVAATVAGRRADVGPAGLPLPDGEGVLRVEVRYRLPATGGWTTAPAPELPGQVGPVPVRWTFDPEVRRWPTLDAPAEPTPGDTGVWTVPAIAVRLTGYLLAVVMAVTGIYRWSGLAVVTGLLAVAGWVAPGGWREVARPPAAIGLLALAVRWPRPTPTPSTRRLPSTASYGTAAVCLVLMGATSQPVRIDTAEYELTVGDGGTATGTARFMLNAPAAGPFTLSLVGVRLEDVNLDGQSVSAAATLSGYAVDLPPGPHTLSARFAVPVVMTGGRLIRFGVPDVPQCRVTVVGPPGADVASRRGMQRVNNGKLIADHGSGTAVELRWVSDAPPAAVREACVWEVVEGTDRGLFAARLAPVTGPVVGATVEIPDGVEIGPPTVRTDNGASPTVGWKREPGRVRVTITPPSDRPVWFILPLVATGPALRGPTTGAAESFLALRGRPFTEVGRAGVIDFPADGLRAFTDVPELRLTTNPPTRVFQRRPGQPAELSPKFAPPSVEPATAETLWTVGPVLTATGTVRAERVPTGMIHFDLPPEVTLIDARAGDGTRWTRTGSRITVWLTGPTAEPVTATWVGTLPAGGGVRELPGATPVGGAATVRAVPIDGWAVLPLPDSTPGRLRVRVLPPDLPASPTLAESVDRAADGLTYQATINLPLMAGRPHRLRLYVADLPTGMTPGLQATGPRVGPAERTSDGTNWLVESDRPASLILTAKLTPPARLPEVTVRFDGPPVVWADRSLTVAAGLVADGRMVAVTPPPPVTVPVVAVPPPPVAFEPHWLRAAGWLAAFGLVLLVRPPMPERLMAVGVLGSAAVSGSIGWGFLGLAAIGAVLRLIRLGAAALR